MKPNATTHSQQRKQKKSPAPNEDSKTAGGGELHQIAGGNHPELTTNLGIPISDNQNSLKANPRGPTLLEDFVLREKITHFDHERIPERIVHARATGVHGLFELTDSLKRYTTAKILTEVGEKTPVFTRISTVAGGAGSVDFQGSGKSKRRIAMLSNEEGAIGWILLWVLGIPIPILVVLFLLRGCT
jgi:catalase